MVAYLFIKRIFESEASEQIIRAIRFSHDATGPLNRLITASHAVRSSEIEFQAKPSAAEFIHALICEDLCESVALWFAGFPDGVASKGKEAEPQMHTDLHR